jgi:hypothetical protein
MVDGGKEKGTARTVFHASVFLLFLVRWISGLSLPRQRISRLPGVNRNCQLASMHDCICSPSQLARAPSCTKYILGEEKALQARDENRITSRRSRGYTDNSDRKQDRPRKTGRAW